MYINENTKISALIRYNPKSIDAIASISKNFDKLKIPVLRNVLASRVSIKQAAKIGGSSVDVFYNKLIPLGFIIKSDAASLKTDAVESSSYNFQNLSEENIVELDVREMLKAGKDPFNVIMESLSTLSENSILKIVNTFEPTPLISILSKKGYIHNTIIIEKQLVHTYFKKEITTKNSDNTILNDSKSEEITQVLKSFGTNTKEIDVRHLEMPLPMATILNELHTLPEDYMLFVHHKKVPKFLFPELAERGYQWRIQIISVDYVKLFIFK
ncbi:MAG: DUF2249 domain-containing protein [Sphingobacteriaceae bacterium]|nr:DUF2249 domain-containing protein [Sphingobacteriaceae bacterium]MBP8032964.1 DUF2249 domain-containing protein [Bacteroidia bacterium]